MKNNLLKIALSLGMIVAVSGMQDASCSMNSDNNKNPINNDIHTEEIKIIQENMDNINNESSQENQNTVISKRVKNIKKINKKNKRQR